MRETTRPSPNQAAPTIKHKFKFSFDVGNDPPQIVVEAPAHIHCHEGEAVVLECAVSGQPPPAVVWSLNGQNLSASERLRFEEGKNGVYRLHIQGVSVADAGLYCCVAKNVAGTAQTASELTVQPSGPKLYIKDGGTEELPAMDHVLHFQGLITLGKDEEKQITCSKEEEAHLPWSPRLSPSPGEQLEEECEKTPDFSESEMEETMVLDIMEVVPHIDTLSWDILKSPFMEVEGQTQASEQSALAKECEDSQFFIPISPVVQEGSDIYMEERDGPAWKAMSLDMPLVEEPSVPHLQDNIASTPTEDQFGFYDFCIE
uniref:Ig-like domain-containing protein n=1 Tax=Otus sunia TaxID=257818 RepID=A0A8C8AEG5_9STRI